MNEFEKLTLKAVIDKSAEKFADKPSLALIGEESISYAKMREQIRLISNALYQRGIRKGDKVAILSENSPSWPMCYFAIATMGAIAVPILPDFHKNEVHHIIRNSESKIVFTTKKYGHKLENGRLGNLELIVLLDDSEGTNEVIKSTTMTEFLATRPDKKAAKMESIEVEEGDLAEILYTSGTTGHSKGVMLSHKNIVSNAIAAHKAIRIDFNDRLLSILPLAHVYECTCGMIAPVMGGASITYIVGLPTAQTLIPAMQQIKPTIVLSVPLVMEKIYKKRVVSEVNSKKALKVLYKIALIRLALNKIIGKKLYQAFGGNLRFIVFGGAATSPEVENFLKEGNFPYTTGYGLTETSPLLTVNPIGQVRNGSCGKVVDGVEVRIVDVDPKSGAGEIVARGPNVMQGYYKNPDETRKIMSDGWLKTGDLGYFDEDGYLFISGRSKNVIVGPSGENIFPELIEHVIGQNPFVLESLVYEYEGRLVARVFLDYDAIDAQFDTQKMNENEARQKINELLEQIRIETNNNVSSFSRIHRMIEQPEEFEKTPTKKIKRYLYIHQTA